LEKKSVKIVVIYKIIETHPYNFYWNTKAWDLIGCLI